MTPRPVRRLRCWILASWLIAVIGCGKGSPTGAIGDMPDYYPVSVGSWWVFYYSAFSGTAKDSVADTTTLPGGIAAYVIRHRSAFGNPPHEDTSTTYIVRTAREVRRYYARPDTYSYTVLRFPLKVGDAWSEWTTFDGMYDSMTVAGRGTVSIPAGSFARCFHVIEKCLYDPYSSVQTREFCYAPDVGFVRGRLFASDTIELIDYHIN